MLLETAGWCESFYVCFLVPDLLFGPAVRFFLLHESVFSSCYNNEMELIYMLSLVFIKCSVLATSRICSLMGTLLPFSIGNNRQVYCEVFCIWRYVNRVAHPILSYK